MLIDKIKECLLPYDFIVAAWLFGSQATGRARPDSDVDIALLTEEPLNSQQRLSIQIDLEEALSGFRSMWWSCTRPLLFFALKL